MQRILTVSWFAIWPAMVLLVGRTIYERACLALSEPWPWLLGRPSLSLVIGAIYVGAHWWIGLWAVEIGRRQFADQGTRAQEGQGKTGARGLAGRGGIFGLAMLALLAIDYSPLTPWRWILHALGC